MNSSPEMLSNDTVTLIATVALIFTIYWSIRGFVQLFQRHNSILVIFYLVFLFPIAFEAKKKKKWIGITRLQNGNYALSDSDLF
jgi:hypothetical protein